MQLCSMLLVLLHITLAAGTPPAEGMTLK